MLRMRCAGPGAPRPDKSASRLPFQTPLPPVPTRPASAPASPHQTPRRLPLAAPAAGPLPTRRWSPFPLIPPPQACRCSPPLPRPALCALPADGLRPLPVSASASSARNPASPLLRHASGKILAAVTHWPQMRRPVAPLLHASAAAGLSQACVFLSFPHFITLASPALCSFL